MRTCVPSSSVTSGMSSGLHFLIARRGHFLRRRKIGPELEAVHAASRIALGHFLVDDAAAGGHPLHVAGGDGAAVPHAVAVFDGSGEDVGDGLDAAVRMPGKSGKIVLGNVVAEIVEEQEGIEVMRVAETESAAEMDSGAFERGFGLDEALDGAYGHGDLRLSGIAHDLGAIHSFTYGALMLLVPCRTQARRGGRVTFHAGDVATTIKRDY